MAFFDKVGATLSSVGNNVSNKTKGMVEVSNLNSQIKSCENQRRGYYEEIGRMYYAKCNGESEDPEIAQAFAKIKEAGEAIDHLQKSLKKAKGVVICCNCNSEMPNGTMFCSVCGSRIAESQPANNAETSESKTCAMCGSVNVGDAAFCATCGSKL